MGKIKIYAIIINYSNYNQNQSTGNDVLINRLAAIIHCCPFCQGKRERYSGNKKEHRENHIIKMETMPWNMFTLFGPPFKNWPSCKCRKSDKNSFSSHNPEHIEPA